MFGQMGDGGRHGLGSGRGCRCGDTRYSDARERRREKG